jgi:Clr5 domain
MVNDRIFKNRTVDNQSATHAKRIPESVWGQHKDTISRLYLDEGLTLLAVRDRMKKGYGFEATYVLFSSP